MMDYFEVHCVTKISIAALLAAATAGAERTPLAGVSELIQALDRLNVVGRLLHIAAHPDDETTAVLAYFARGRHIRTAYLSATRGEGGQNLVGSEQYEALGLIRTQELLAARRIDGAGQFFTRAFDFGYSKSADEALEKWGREPVLADLVRGIRRFRPDVVFARFPPSGGQGHGQHLATGRLAPLAFAAAADPARFPDQILEGLAPWQARRLITQGGRGDPLSIDAGAFDFVLGRSYAEIAAESRSRHSSQAFGREEPRGPQRQWFRHVAGQPASGEDPFEGIDTTWNRVPGAARLAGLLARARREVEPGRPDRLLPVLLEAWQEMARLHDPLAEGKRGELERAIELAAGLWLDAAADRWDPVPGSSLELTLTALNRSSFPMTWERVEVTGAAQGSLAAGRTLGANTPERIRVDLRIPPGAPYSQPYWLRRPRHGDLFTVEDPSLIGLPESPPALAATFFLRAGSGTPLRFRVPVRYRWVDSAAGELVRDLAVIPPVSVAFAQSSTIFPEAAARPVVVRVTARAAPAQGRLVLDLPAGWTASPESIPFDLADRGQQAGFAFEVTPPAAAGGGYARARALLDGVAVSETLVSIRHPHIPPQDFLEPARARLERFDVRLTARSVGYVMGAGDEIPRALEQLGASVRLLTAEDLAGAELARYDAIVAGVRALNVRPDLVAARRRLLDYIAAGGTLVVQYNRTSEGNAGGLAPYPLTPSDRRVSVEDAPVTVPEPDLPLLHRPNRITARDFDGWVQERGLYFMVQWDPRYRPAFVSNDPGEHPQAGGTLVARYGRGVYIFTGYSWFRQLPAGVPGAWRIFANLLSAGR